MTGHPAWPAIPLHDWRETRDTLHQRARAVGAIPRALADPHPHWWHISLRAGPDGLSTVPLQGVRAQGVRIVLDPHRHTIRFGDEEIAADLPMGEIAGRLAAAFGVSLDPEDLASPERYDRAAVARSAMALDSVVAVFDGFRDRLAEHTSPVHMWPHHMDLALTWFSGRTVPDTDPADPDINREQASIGFSTGDEGTAEPYFYGIAYPFPEDLADAELPGAARWITGAYTGALLPYAAVIDTPDPKATLRSFLEAFYSAAAGRMR